MWLKLLIAAGLVVLFGGTGAVIYYINEKEPVRKRGSAREEFDPSARPEPRKPPPRRRAKRSADWPTFGYDAQRNKVSPYGHRPPYRRTWRIDAHDTIEFPPSAAYGNVYLAQQHGLFFALNGRTGRKIFKRKNFKRCAASSPTIAKGTIYQAYMHHSPCPQGASNPNGFVTAMNARTGREKWRFWAKPIESTPLYHRGVLYFGSWDRNVYAVSARTGKKIWSFQTDGKVNTSAVYSKGRIFIATDGGSVYALGVRNGRQAWRAHSQSRFGSREFFYATPTVAYGRIFIGNTDGTMYAFGQRTGKLLWAHPLGSYVYSSAAVYNRRVYVGTYDGRFYALDVITGDTRWQRNVASAVHAPPVVMGGLVYATTCSSCGSAASRAVKRGTDGTTAYDARSGRVRWHNNAGKYASAIVADRNRVYLTGRSHLFALEPRKAKRRSKRAAAKRRAATRRQAKRGAAKRRAARAKARRRKRGK